MKHFLHSGLVEQDKSGLGLFCNKGWIHLDLFHSFTWLQLIHEAHPISFYVSKGLGWWVVGDILTTPMNHLMGLITCLLVFSSISGPPFPLHESRFSLSSLSEQLFWQCFDFLFLDGLAQ